MPFMIFWRIILQCHFWTPDVEDIPKIKDISLPEINLIYSSPFIYREHFTHSVRYNPEFAAKLKENGYWQKNDIRYGETFKILGFAHTFSELLPINEYYTSHPDWFCNVNKTNLKQSVKTFALNINDPESSV